MENIKLEIAMKILEDNIATISEKVEMDILDSLGYILSSDICSTINNPPFDRSPLDGFTFHSDSFKSDKKEYDFEVIGEVMAGDVFSREVSLNQAVRIMTGAPIPKGCNCVVRQEDVEFYEEKNLLKVFKKLKEYQNYCFKGEDFKQGEVLIEKGEKITPNHIGVIASLGISKVEVYRNIKVGLISTGSELCKVGEPLKEGGIYNSNMYLIGSKLKSLGAEIVFLDSMSDNINEVSESIREKIKGVDLLITTGGVSVGKADIIHDVIVKLGARRLFWKVDIQPGTPVLAFIYNEKPIISLSGNPFAALVNFELLVKHSLNYMTSGKINKNSRKKAVTVGNFPKKSKRRRFIRGKYLDGKVYLEANNHSSGQIHSTLNKNCLIDTPKGTESIKDNIEVEVVVID